MISTNEGLNSSRQCWSLHGNIAFHLRSTWLQTLVAINSESCETSIPSFCAPPMDRHLKPCAQIQGVFKSTTDTDSDWLALGKVLPLVRYGHSSRVKGFDFWAVTTIFVFHAKMEIRWISRELVTDQSSNHRFAQSFNHSLVSG